MIYSAQVFEPCSSSIIAEKQAFNFDVIVMSSQ